MLEVIPFGASYEGLVPQVPEIFLNPGWGRFELPKYSELGQNYNS